MNKKIRRQNVMSATLLLLLITLSTATLSQAANIKVTSSRNPVALDDSFHLIYEADSDVDGEPDFSPIYQNFDVLNSGQSTNMRFINGKYSLKKSWDLSVIAKTIGKFTIPSIDFGKDVSPSIQITISNSTSPNSVAPDGQSSIPAKIFLEAVLDKKEGWVQSQFIYKLRLLRTVSIVGASLTEPVTNDPDAIIDTLGEDSYQTTRNGIKYEVIERRYAIFPQRSGQLKIQPGTFEGRINSTQSRSIFDQFRMSGQLKRLHSNAVEATIKAAPASINLQDWIPASKLQLVEEWSGDIQAMNAGEPITRTITIAADGLGGTSLPDLKFSEIADLKQYPDKPVVENRQSEAGIIGLKQIKTALIPAKAGTYTLPEIKLSWWNTNTNKLEVASIAATTLSVKGIAPSATVANNSSATAPEQTAVANALPKVEPPTAATTIPASATLAIDNPIYWQWLSLLLGSAWLITLVLLFKKRAVTNTISNTASASQQSIKSAANKVAASATANAATKTTKALIVWAKVNYADDTITNLTQITAYCSPRLSEEIRQLNHALYGTTLDEWHGKDFLVAFKNERKNRNQHQDEHTTALKPLYHS